MKTDLVKHEIEIPEIPKLWDYDSSVKKVKELLANGGREAFRKLTHYEKLLKGTNIYFIQEGKTGSIKIGESTKVENRLKQLQIGNPNTLYLIGTIKNVPLLIEKKIQNKFKKYHLRYEWYKSEIKDEIERMTGE